MENIGTIFKGEIYTLKLVIKKSDGRLYDLTDATEITVRLQQEGTSVRMLKLLSDDDVVVVSELGGEISCELDADDTALLLEKDLQDFDVLIEKSGVKRVAYFSRKLNVRKAIA